MTIYINEIKKLLDAITHYEKLNCSEEELANLIVNVSNQVVNIEENALRNYLQNIESDM